MAARSSRHRIRSIRKSPTPPSAPSSAAYVASIGLSCTPAPSTSEPRRATASPMRSPHRGQPRVPGQVHRIRGSESNRGRSPIPADTPIEGGPGAEGDRHVLVDPGRVRACSTSCMEAGSRRSGLDSCLRRGLEPAQQRAAPGRMDLRRRRRPADLPAARALSGGRLRTDRPCAAGHGAANAARLHPPRHPLRVREL